MAWRSMDHLRLGSAELAALKGKRVRSRRAMTLHEFLGPDRPFGTHDLAAGRIGFVGHAYRDGVVLGFPDRPPESHDRLETMMRSAAFRSVHVDAYNFAQGFEIDS